MSTLLAQRHLQQQRPRARKSGGSKWISETYLVVWTTVDLSTQVSLSLDRSSSRCGWRHGGSSLMGMCWNWLGSPAQHSQLDHQRVTAQSCRTLTYWEAVWHIKSGRQGVSQRGRQPRLHNNDLRRSRDGKFLKQTRTSLSTSGLGALRLREWGLFGWQFLKKAAAGARCSCWRGVPPLCCRWRGFEPLHLFHSSCCGCEDVGCRAVQGLVLTLNYFWSRFCLTFVEHIGVDTHKDAMAPQFTCRQFFFFKRFKSIFRKVE